MIIVINGADTYRSRQYCDKIVTKFRSEKDPAGYNIVTVDAETASAGSLTQELFSAPFLAEKRLVLIKNSLSVSKSSAVPAELLDILKNRPIPESTVAVFWDRVDEVKGKTTVNKVWELLSKEKYKESFPLLSASDAANFFCQEIVARGGQADRSLGVAAVNCVGVESLPLILLADQLVAFKRDEKKIVLNDLQEFVTAPGDDNIFNLVDALIQGRIPVALTMMRAQYAKGEDDQFIFQMLIRQLRIMLLIADCLSNGETSPDSIAKKLDLHPFVVKKTVPIVKTFSSIELQLLFKRLAEFDLVVKTGRGDLEILLDTLVVSIGTRKK